MASNYPASRKPLSPEHRADIATRQTGSGNPMWKGDDVGYGALHDWVKARLIKPPFCMGCGNASPVDLANISGRYLRDLTDWEWLCRRCHMTKDGRLRIMTERNTQPRTHCVNGHEYDERNTGSHGGYRRCRTCARVNTAMHRQRAKEKARGSNERSWGR